MDNRTLVVGWDSVSWNFVDPLMKMGKLPNLKKLMAAGCVGELRSTVPPVTPVAWSSIITGKHPAQHGVYDFAWWRDEEVQTVTSFERIGTPFWQRLNESGFRVGLVNIPLTYPPPKIDGFVICGFGAPPPPAVLTYPAIIQDIAEQNYGPYRPVLAPEEVTKYSKLGELYSKETQIQHLQVTMALESSEIYKTHLLVINLMLFDHTNHRFSDMDIVNSSIIELDKQLGRLIDGFRPDNIILLADHGAKRVNAQFLLANWLSDSSYLVYRPSSSIQPDQFNHLLQHYLRARNVKPSVFERSIRKAIVKSFPSWSNSLRNRLLEDIASKVPQLHNHYLYSNDVDIRRSFVQRARNIGVIYLNKQYPEYPNQNNKYQLIERLKHDLSSIQDPATGSHIFKQVLTKEEIYGENIRGEPPDIFLDYHDSGFALRCDKGVNLIIRDKYFAYMADNLDSVIWHWRGDHSNEGVFVLSGRAFHNGLQMGLRQLVDIPALILYMHRVPIPSDYSGDIGSKFFRLTHQKNSQPADPEDVDTASGSDRINADDNGAILDRLRSLGYME